MLLSHRHTLTKTKQLIKHSYLRISTLCGFEVALFQHFEYVKLHIIHCPLLVMRGLCSQQVHVIWWLEDLCKSVNGYLLPWTQFIVSSNFLVSWSCHALLRYFHLFTVKVWWSMGGVVSAISFFWLHFSSPWALANKVWCLSIFGLGKMTTLFVVWSKTTFLSGKPFLVVTLKDDWRPLLKMRCVKFGNTSCQRVHILDIHIFV